MKWGLKGGISIDADSGPSRYVLWCCGGICHQPDTFFKIGSGHTVKERGDNQKKFIAQTGNWIHVFNLENQSHEFSLSISTLTRTAGTHWDKALFSWSFDRYIHIPIMATRLRQRFIRTMFLKILAPQLCPKIWDQVGAYGLTSSLIYSILTWKPFICNWHLGFDPEDLFIFHSILFLKTWSMFVVIQCNEENGKKVSILTFALIHLEMHSYIQGRRNWRGRHLPFLSADFG